LLILDRVKSEEDRDIPLKTTTSGYRMGLTVLVRTNPQEYYATNLASFGVKVSSGNLRLYGFSLKQKKNFDLL
jgi:hypothetical protein